MNKTSEISGYFNDEASLFRAIKELKENKTWIKDVFTPFPVHGLDKALGLKRSLLPKAAFIGGTIGALSGFFFQAWVFTKAYPLNFGGKPFLSVPSFIPITFECTILFAAFAIVFAFLFRSKLGMGAKNKIYREESTDDKFVVVINTGESTGKKEIEILKKQFESTGALGVTIHE